MKKQKYSFLALTIVLLSVFATSCIPNTPDGDPTPANTFDVNFSDTVFQYPNTSSTHSSIIIDNDTLTFQFITAQFFGPTEFLIILSSSPNFEGWFSNEYSYNLTTNNYDTAFVTGGVNTINDGVLINGAGGNPWIPFSKNADGLYVFYSILYGYSVDFLTSSTGMKRNVNQYIVLRRLKGTAYQYYWIRIRNDDFGTLQPQLDRHIKILNGKYQLNSIITGQ